MIYLYYILHHDFMKTIAVGQIDAEGRPRKVYVAQLKEKAHVQSYKLKRMAEDGDK